MNKILIAVPCHDMVHAEFNRCMMELERPEGIEIGYAQITGTLVYTARTLIANKAVELGFDRVLWVDSDMTPPADTLIRLNADMDKGRNCNKYLSKGNKVCVTGTVSVRVYTNNKGEATGQMEVRADEVEFLSAKGEGKIDKQSGYEQVTPDDLPY